MSDTEWEVGGKFPNDLSTTRERGLSREEIDSHNPTSVIGETWARAKSDKVGNSCLDGGRMRTVVPDPEDAHTLRIMTWDEAELIAMDEEFKLASLVHQAQAGAKFESEMCKILSDTDSVPSWLHTIEDYLVRRPEDEAQDDVDDETWDEAELPTRTLMQELKARDEEYTRLCVVDPALLDMKKTIQECKDRDGETEKMISIRTLVQALDSKDDDTVNDVVKRFHSRLV